MKFSSGLEQNLKTEFLDWYKGEHEPSSTTVWWPVSPSLALHLLLQLLCAPQ